MATEFKYTRQAASAEVPLRPYVLFLRKQSKNLKTDQLFATACFPVLFLSLSSELRFNIGYRHANLMR